MKKIFERILNYFGYVKSITQTDKNLYIEVKNYKTIVLRSEKKINKMQIVNETNLDSFSLPNLIMSKMKKELAMEAERYIEFQTVEDRDGNIEFSANLKISTLLI